MRSLAAFVALASLCVPAHAAPIGAVDIARSFLAGRADLTGRADLIVERVSPSGPGGLVKLRRTHRGLPVMGGSVAVRLGAGGEVLWAGADRGVVPPDLPVVPALSAEDAVRTASGGALDDPAAAKLLVWAMPERRARLAWRVDLPLSLAELTQWRVLIDAQDGQVLARQNLVQTAGRAKVFTSGSPAYGSLEVVTLNITPGATVLKNADIETRNCIDKNTCPLKSSGQLLHFCVTEPKARADASGDFLYERPASDVEPEDEFSEVQMFYHSDRILQKFRSLGLAGLEQRPMNVYMNVRGIPFEVANADCTALSPLRPFENAFFTTGGPPWPTTPAMVFGQGKDVDYAYDGSVVYHELTHAAQNMLYGRTFSHVYTDKLGMNVDGGAMSEGTADFFSAATSGNSLIGAYSLGPQYDRDVSNVVRCPDGIRGEEHDDSEMFSSALWSARNAVAEAQRTTFDQAVYNALDAFGDTESFDSAQKKIVAEMRRLAGDAAGTTVATKLADQGMNGCNGRIAELASGAKWPWLYLDTPFSVSPAPVQFRIVLDKPYDRLILAIDQVQRSSGTPVDINAVTKPGSDAIVWDPDRLTHDGSPDRAVAIGSGGINSSTVLPGPFPAGPVIVQLVGAGSGGLALLTGISLRGQDAPKVVDAGPSTGNGGDGGGCAVGRGRAAGAWWLAVAALAALRRVTSRRACRCGRGNRTSP